MGALRCPAVPKAESIVELPFFCKSKFSDFKGNVVIQLEAGCMTTADSRLTTDYNADTKYVSLSTHFK